MRRIFWTAATFLPLVLSPSCWGAETSNEIDRKILNSATAESVKSVNPASSSVEACWNKWKKAEDLTDGKNDRNGHLVMVSHQQMAVNQDLAARNWLAARKYAFESAEILGRASLADTMKTLISSDRSAAHELLGGDDAAPSLKPAVRQLSIADKTNVLVDKALDNEIAKYDPDWNNKSPADKKVAAAILQGRIQSNIASHSELYAAGAFTVVECEGPSDEDNGKYSVLVGMIWSPKLAKVAEAIWNPSFKLPAEMPQASLNEQFAQFTKENASWLAYTMGARVFTNEKGERVVVGFGAVPQSSMMGVDKRRAILEALGAISHFVGEKIEANAETSDALEQTDFTNGQSQFFDSSAFREKIALRSKDLKLAGAAEVLSWRGSHPWSDAKMQVVAIAWSPSWAADSEQAANLMHSIEIRMGQQGAVPTSTEAPKRAYKGAGAAAPVNRGASSSTHDF